MERLARTVWVAQIEPGLWLHTTTGLIEGGVYYPANGLILERPGGALLIDTGNRGDQAETLIAWSKRRLTRPISQAIATHFHNDRTSGVTALAALGVRTFAHPLTCELAAAAGLPVPEPILGFGAAPHAFGEGCELYFPGPGHSRDNIVVWLPQTGVLFGGCFLKSITSNGLGNLADAVVGEWASSVRRVQERYRGARRVIPGHGTIAPDPIAKTLALLAKQASP